MRVRVGWVFGVVAVLALALVLYVALSKRPQPPSAPPVAPLSVPGDAYIDQTAKDYVAVVIAGDTGRIQRLNSTVVDPEAARRDTLGGFASVPAKYLKVRAVRDERVYSGNGPAKPATSWSAVVTVESKRAGAPGTLDVQLNGTYGSPGTVDSAHALSVQ